MITIQNVSKSYDDNKVLDDVSIRINTGEIYGIIGRSGAGKSTLLRCINGLENFDSGRILVDDVDIQGLENKDLLNLRKDIGMIFQQFSLLERLNVVDNVSLQMKFWKIPKEERKARAHELLMLVGLEDKANAFPNELSGGQKQRVAIARALSMNPSILLCDEATSALDPTTANSVIDLLMEINESLGITIVVVTHQMSVLKRCCQRMSIIENGSIVESGSVEDIFINQTEPLKRLIGTEESDMPTTGRNIKFIMPANTERIPIVSEISRNLGIDVIVLGGAFEKFRDHKIGTIYINVDGDKATEVTDYLTSKNIHWNYVDEGETA